MHTHIDRFSVCVCGYRANKEGLSAGFTPQWKSRFGSAVSQWHLLDLTWVWCLHIHTHTSTCGNITVFVHPDSMYVQNVKTGSLLVSQRSCLFSYIDGIGALANKTDSDLNCLLVGKCPRSVWFIQGEKHKTDSGSQTHVPTHIIMSNWNLSPVYETYCVPVSIFCSRSIPHVLHESLLST